MQPKTTYPFKGFLFFIFFATITSLSYSQNIKGKVFDAKTGEPLAGAIVHLKDTKYSTAVNLDGTYLFKNIKPGKYDVQVTSVGYRKIKAEGIVVAATGTTIVGDLQMPVETNDLTEVIVTGMSDKRSDASARNIEKNSARCKTNYSGY